MKYIKYMIVPLLVLALVLSACGKDEKKEKQNKEDKELKKELVNKDWKEKKYFNEEDEGIHYYTFHKDGTYQLDADATIDEGTYTVKNHKLKLKSEDYEDRTIKLNKPLKEFKSHDEPGTIVYKRTD